MSNQVGGDHYQGKGLQPFDVIDTWGLDFYLGSALKYIMRSKPGVKRSEDLRKAEHYLREAAERAEEQEAASRPSSTTISATELTVDTYPKDWYSQPPTSNECWYIDRLGARQLVRIKRVDVYSDGSSTPKSEYVIQYHRVGLDGVAVDPHDISIANLASWRELNPSSPQHVVPDE